MGSSYRWVHMRKVKGTQHSEYSLPCIANIKIAKPTGSATNQERRPGTNKVGVLVVACWC